MAPKSRKKASKPSPSRNRSSPSSPRSLAEAQSPPIDEGDDEALSLSLLQRASSKHPSLISTSAFVGRLTNVEPKPNGQAAILWLSEAAMSSSSLLPRSLVSVSLASSCKNNTSDASPLESLEVECARNFRIDIGNNTADNAGSYFGLAVVFPSSKVLKNGIKLSWSLFCTMGCPDVGRIMFVSLIRNQSIAHCLNGIDKLPDLTNTKICSLSGYKCSKLYLKLVPSDKQQKLQCDAVFHVDGLDCHGNGRVSSPKTPSPYQSKLNSLHDSQMQSERRENYTPSVSHQAHGISLDVSIIEKFLEDEKVKQIMEISASWWLNARCLLLGNLVAIPVGTQIALFQVDGMNSSVVECSGQDLTHEGKSSLLPHAISCSSVAGCKDSAFVVGAKTKVHLNSSRSSSDKIPVKGDLFPMEDAEVPSVPKLGGLSKEFAELNQVIFDKIQHHANYTGVLLHGPPGTGKTSLAYSCAHYTGIKLFSINGPEIVSEVYGKSERDLRHVFEQAKQATSAMVFIDELDAIAPARKNGSEQLSQRIVVTLLKLMDEIRTTGVLVVAATNRPDSVDPALRRHGRFDREIEIGVPSRAQRLDILLTLLSEMRHSLVDAEIRSLASSTHGFVGADLAALCNKAAMLTLRRYNKYTSTQKFPTLNQQHLEPDHTDSVMSLLSEMSISSESKYTCSFDKKAPDSMNTSQGSNYLSIDGGACVVEEEPYLRVTFDDFEKARMKVRPSAMREVMIEVPKVSWEDIGGQEEVKKQLIEAVEWPQKHQNAFKRVGIRPPTGVLMFGPPGCSKTLMARAVASNAGLNFLAVKGPELFSKWVGESEKAVRSLFNKARAAAPSIIFFDEIDGLAVTRGQENDGVSVADRVMTQLLVELDGLKQRVDVTVIAATNRPDKIDPALLRPGRFDRLLYVGPPNQADRESIFRIHLRKMPCASDFNVGILSSLTEGCTGADISAICREAALVALEESIDISEVSMRHFEVAFRRVQPLEVHSYEEFATKFQRLVRSRNC